MLCFQMDDTAACCGSHRCLAQYYLGNPADLDVLFDSDPFYLALAPRLAGLPRHIILESTVSLGIQDQAPWFGQLSFDSLEHAFG